MRCWLRWCTALQRRAVLESFNLWLSADVISDQIMGGKSEFTITRSFSEQTHMAESVEALLVVHWTLGTLCTWPIDEVLVGGHSTERNTNAAVSYLSYLNKITN